MLERLQKILSSSGVTSRRQGEQWIEQGRVTVNGQVAHLGEKADIEVDQICVDGVPLHPQDTLYYYMLHKPRGYVTTLSDEQNRPTVAHLMQSCGVRLWPVGRLDFNSEGLLLMTNDGELTHKLLHPRFEIQKEYEVRVDDDSKQALLALSQPITLDGELLAPAKVQHLTSGKISITIHQGKNRQIRRMCASVGMKVRRLKRIREGTLLLDPTLACGQYRPLTPEEVALLKQEVATSPLT